MFTPRFSRSHRRSVSTRSNRHIHRGIFPADLHEAQHGFLFKKLLLLLVSGGALMVVLTGCAAHSGSLSEASSKASTENTGSRTMTVTIKEDDNEKEEEKKKNKKSSVCVTHYVSDPQQPPSIRFDTMTMIGVHWNRSGQIDGPFSNMASFGIAFRTRQCNELRNSITLRATGMTKSLMSNHTLLASLKKNLWGFGGSIEFERLRSANSAVTYGDFIMGASLGCMVWDYRNPIILEKKNEKGEIVSTEKITSDGLGLLELYTGFTIVSFHHANFSTRAALLPGIEFRFDRSVNGFKNDLFKWVTLNANIQCDLLLR